MLAAVITTIHPPTAAVRALAGLVPHLVVIGDAKGPTEYLTSADF